MDSPGLRVAVCFEAIASLFPCFPKAQRVGFNGLRHDPDYLREISGY
jgi:hypothetical protein